MTNEKLDCMKNYYGTPYGKLQVVYLYEVVKFSIEQIQEITGYVYSTVRSYINKYKEDLQEAIEIFFYGGHAEGVVWECNIADNETPCAYVCEIYDVNGFKYLKIGYSKRMLDRMSAHSKNKRYGAVGCVVKSFYCFDSEEQALSMENLLRKYYKEKLGENNFLRNDRFLCSSDDYKRDFNIFSEKALFILENF